MPNAAPRAGRRLRYSIIIQFLAVIGSRDFSLGQLGQNTKYHVYAGQHQADNHGVLRELAL